MNKIYHSIAPGLLALATLCSADVDHHVPADKGLSSEWTQSLYQNSGQKVYRGEELHTIGMPVGGIAAGQLYVRGDGTLANWWIANNAYNTGYGIDKLMSFETKMGPWKVCYQKFKPTSYIDQGFAIQVKDKDGKISAKNLNESGFDAIEFVGEYPIATIHYKDSEAFPVDVSSQVFSPFIPLNAKDSALPLTLLKYTVTNKGTEALSVSLGGWLQNLVCQELRDSVSGLSENTVIQRSQGPSVKFDLIPEPSPQAGAAAEEGVTVIEDFNQELSGWKVEGTAFSNTPAQGAVGVQQPVSGNRGGFVNSFQPDDKSTGKMTSKPFLVSDDYLTFLIGGGNHPGKLGVNLKIGGEVVRSSTGANSEQLRPGYWKVSEFKGKQAVIEIVDTVTGGWGHILVDEFAFSKAAPNISFPTGHPYLGNVSLSLLGEGQATASFEGALLDQLGEDFASREKATASLGTKLNGAIKSDFSLQPGESKTLTFALSWYFPNRKTDPGIEAYNWSSPIPTTGAPVGQMYDNWFDSSQEVIDYFAAQRERLEAETFAFHRSYYQDTNLPYWLSNRLLMPLSILASETCQWWKNGRFWAYEGVGSCHGTCTHVWNYEHAMARFFPSLERNVRQEQDFGVAFNPNGGVNTRGVNGGVYLDGHCGAILKAYREHLISKDGDFLARHWPKIKQAMLFMIELDAQDGKINGLIEGQQLNTYDIAFFGANTYVGGLYLAALKASGKMAVIMNDRDFAKRCAKIAEDGSKNSVSRLWNGEYFIQDVDLEKHPVHQFGDGCLSDQMFGQAWAHQLNLGYLYPQDKVKKSLASIWRYNWAPDVSTQNKVHPPERTYAKEGEAGLFICTWPKSKHLGENGVRYRNEVWTGIEYQVAANMIDEGMLDQGLSLIKGVDNRYDGTTNNPWNEIECGDHYARAMASWGVMVSLQGYHYDGPREVMTVKPKIQKDDFKSFFTAAEAWGNIKQTRTAGVQVNTIEPKYGQLSIRVIQVEALANTKGRYAVTLNGTPVAFSTRLVDGDLVFSCRQAAQLKKGDTLQLEQR